MSVELGDDATYPMRGVGSISFQTPIGDVLELSNVLYVLGLKKNLLLVSCMEDLQCMLSLMLKRLSLEDGNQVVEKGVHVGGLYRLQDPVKHGALMHDNTKLCELWHIRGHLHYGALPILKKLVQGLPYFKIEKEGVCKGCALGKHVKTAFPSSEHRSRGSLDLIHFDVCGPMSSASLTSSCYYVTFIEDFSHKTWIYFLKTKDEVFNKFT
jgi:hypothetical protein